MKTFFFDVIYDAMLSKARETYVDKTIRFVDQNFYQRTVKCVEVEIVMDDDNYTWMVIIDDAGNRYVCSGGDYNIMGMEIEVLD